MGRARARTGRARLQLDGPRRRARRAPARAGPIMSVPLRVLITTDSFPPICGGSGWSTWELARGLAARGHHVEVVKVETGLGEPGAHESRLESLRVTTF